MEHGRESDQESRASNKKCSKNSGNESKKMEEEEEEEEEESKSETESSSPEEGSEEEVQSQESGVTIHSNYRIVGRGGVRDEEEDAFVDEEESGEEEEKSAEEEQFHMEEDAFTDETQSSASEQEENEEEGESQETGGTADSRYPPVGEEELSGEDTDDSVDEDQSDTEEVVLAGPNPPPALHPDIKNWIQTLSKGQDISISDEILVIQKLLFESEANGDRFIIPLGIIWNELFNDDEIKILNIENFIRVTMIDPVVENVFVELKRNLMLSSDKAGGEPSRAYVLIGDWNRFAAAKNLEEGDIVQLWAVRVGGNLCFLLVKLSTGGGDGSGYNASISGGTDESEAQANRSSPSTI